MSLSNKFAKEKQNFSTESMARISSIGVFCIAECYSKALLNYLAASNLPEPTYTRHAAHLADVTSAQPKSKSPLTGGQAA